jgi:broad specificity phosphatase PhoE
VRHGSTDDSDRVVRGGDTDGPALNEAGWRQVAALAGALAPGDHIVSSPMLRARQTAAVLAEELGMDQADVDPAWAEEALGEWDGLGYAEITRRWPHEYKAWWGSTALAPPGGESLDAVKARTAVACDALVASRPGQTVIVVSHTAPIRALIARALDAGPAALWRLRLEPASVSVIRYWSDGGLQVAGVNQLPIGFGGGPGQRATAPADDPSED